MLVQSEVKQMRFSVHSDMLKNGVLSVSKALPVRSPMPVLEGVQLNADENGVLLRCSDLTLQKEYRLPAIVEESGECVIKGRIFSDIVRKLPDGNAFFSMDGHTLTIRCGRSVNQLQCMEYDEFPQMTFDGDDTFAITFDREKGKRLIDHTVFAVALDDTHPALSGVLLESEGKLLSMVATDSFQFAKNTMTVEKEAPSKRVVVPGKTVAEIGRMLEEGEGDASLTFSRTHMKADMGETVLISRLIDSDYIDYKRILPKACKTRVLVDREALMESVDRAQLVSRDGNNSVLFRIGAENMVVKAESVVGKVEDELTAQVMGDGLNIAFNPKFILNVLKNVEDDKVYLECNSPINPCVIRPVNSEAYFYLVVPMRIF